ncbi:MAG TPA: D-glycero-beta-D-manno-heptose 1-phosphate adenylyltransferase [Candidatus Polarisedimenticolaceae bacterium]|nr:D-glycero-beta-D-manno-heptose 1-phosphate adenylyltransferase [Candidatus Polarisedimenticolaceae bacterium]
MTPERVRALLAAMSGRRILVVGDLMLDEYVWGDVSRVSPDAPVQVVDIRRRSSAIGGAGNVAHNLRAAGAVVSLAGAVGADGAGDAVVRMARDAGIEAGGVVRDAERPTTVKTRVIARGQQIVRLDEERRAPLGAAARSSLAAAVRRAAKGVDAVLVSDYAKGVVDAALVAELAATGAPVVVDPKVPDFSAYAGCRAITPNRKEAEAATGLTLASEADVREAARRIRAATGAQHVLVTLGERGMAVVSGDEELVVVPASAREVYDVTGAGDTVLAYFGLALASGAAAVDAARLANTAAGVAVARVGTSAVNPADVVAAIEGGSGAGVKAVGPQEALARVERERSLGRRIVFTNGCFDLLHAGHVHLLERARALGDFLVVGLNSDASVRRLKGPERPVVGEGDRVKVLAALDAVGLVTVFDEDTPLELIRRLRPDVLAKGGDYEVATIIGAPDVLSWGGRVETIALMPGRSTTSLVDALKKSDV